MNTPEPIRFVPEWMAAMATRTKPGARFVAFVRMYEDAGRETRTSLRDRTEEVRAMMRGMVGDLEAEVGEDMRTGAQWYEEGFRPMGGAWTQAFKLMVA